MKTYYLLVADSGSAKLFRAEGALDKLQLVHQRSNPAGRLTRSELESDRAGQQRNDRSGMHSFAGDDDAPRHESEQFARELCRLLHREVVGHEFTDLLIAAPPRFLGELRAHLSGECQKVLGKTVHKDLLRVPVPELLAHFEEA